MLSKRQQTILQFLYDYSQTNGFFPTIREICKGTDIVSISVVNYNLRILVELGYIAHSPGRSRTTTLTKRAYDLLKVSQDAESQPVTETDPREHEVKRLQLQIERLKRAYQLEIETYRKEQATLTEEVNKLRMAVACLIGL